MRLIVGLGNPGNAYRNTRHNIGFMVLDHYAKSLGIKYDKQKKYKIARVSDDVYLIKPLTYMNLSGQAVLDLIHKYKADWLEKETEFSTEELEERKSSMLRHSLNDDMLVVYDDIYLPLGTLRIRAKGSDAGHKGIRSIITNIGRNDFARLKIGIGSNSDTYEDMRSSIEHKLSDYVLDKFTGEENLVLESKMKMCNELLAHFVSNGYNDMINHYSLTVNSYA